MKCERILLYNTVQKLAAYTHISTCNRDNVHLHYGVLSREEKFKKRDPSFSDCFIFINNSLKVLHMIPLYFVMMLHTQDKFDLLFGKPWLYGKLVSQISNSPG